MRSIRELYQPSQPSVSYESRDYISYEEKSPDDRLQEFIYCYWRLRTTRKLDHPFTYRVVSDGCVDILLETSSIEQIFVTGFSKSFLQYELGNTFDYLGIRFLPTGFPIIFDIAASELTNQFFPLSDLFPGLSGDLSNLVQPSMNLLEAGEEFDRYFIGLLHNVKLNEPDNRVLVAMCQILEARGSIDIGSLDVGVSERQLRRLFQFYFGESPKVFGKVVRFQNILRAKPSQQSLLQNNLFYEVGYYDQAHFIKEFKNFYGVTPTKAFGR